MSAGRGDRSAGAGIGEIGAGLMVLICAMEGSGEAKSTVLAAKIAKVAKLRIFKDDEAKMNRALPDAAGESGGEALVISQFTLTADTLCATCPGFSAAARPKVGAPLCHHFSRALRNFGGCAANGTFGADMDVELVNQGP